MGGGFESFVCCVDGWDGSYGRDSWWGEEFCFVEVGFVVDVCWWVYGWLEEGFGGVDVDGYGG